MKSERTLSEFHFGVAMAKLNLRVKSRELKCGVAKIELPSGWFVGKAVRLTEGDWRVTIEDKPCCPKLAERFTELAVC